MNPKTLFVILDQLLIEWDQKILLRQIALYRLMCPAGTGQVSPQRLIHSNPISLYLVNTFVFIIFIITLSYQQIHVRSYHYHFICSAHLCSFLSLSLYLVSTFMFILIIITLSFQKETQRWFFLCNPGSINSVRTHFVFPLIFYLGQLTLIFLFIFWYWRKWWLWQLNFSSFSSTMLTAT